MCCEDCPRYDRCCEEGSLKDNCCPMCSEYYSCAKTDTKGEDSRRDSSLEDYFNS